MSDLATITNAAFAYANEPADLATVLGPPSACFRLPAIQSVFKFAETVATQEEMNDLLRRIVPTVGVTDPFKAALMAMVCGTLIEWGASPDEAAGLLLARLPAFLAQAESIAEHADDTDGQTLYSKNPDAFKAWNSLSLMLLPTMAVLTRGAEFRQAARANSDLVRGIEALRERNREANFVAMVLGFTDGMEVIVLHPGEGKGFKVVLEAVNTMAHLFTLLQCELINGGHLPGQPVEAEVLGVATGETAPERLVNDYARWQFYNWTGLRPDGSLGGADMSTWLFVEDEPEAIPEFEGQRVVILGPSVLGMRMWDGNFFANIHDALRSRAGVVEVLTAEQVSLLQERIRQAPR
jgi:hypothetical protein